MYQVERRSEYFEHVHLGTFCEAGEVPSELSSGVWLPPRLGIMAIQFLSTSFPFYLSQQSRALVWPPLPHRSHPWVACGLPPLCQTETMSMLVAQPAMASMGREPDFLPRQ